MSGIPPVTERKEDLVTREENISLDEQEAELAQESSEVLDAAATFLAQHKEVETSHINMTKLRHKVDRNVVTILCLLFILAFLDKAIYNVSQKPLLHRRSCINFISVHRYSKPLLIGIFKKPPGI
jgi:hypothetical protein